MQILVYHTPSPSTTYNKLLILGAELSCAPPARLLTLSRALASTS